ncbi:MAG TPA: hypothetical protein VI912_02055 [Candidatus Bilamarchaeaceae archaeon]|nr:hypothetical protein [Candidatus Bilamarchaeaceae archaeon]
MGQRIGNLRKVYSRPTSYLITVVASLLIGGVLFYFTDYELIVGNFNQIYANSQVIAQVILSILFGINVSILYYKLKTVSALKPKDYGSTATGSILGIIVSGCPSCGVTLASYLGLASFFSSFPFFGLEIKILGILILIYSINNLLKNLDLCEVKV